MKLRKKVICTKMEEYYSMAKNEGTDPFIEYLKLNNNFKYEEDGEFVNIGFGDDLKSVAIKDLWFAFYDVIKDYAFSNEDLNKFEDFVNFKYNQLFS